MLLVSFVAFRWSGGSQETYCNPILSGFHPDPSICAVGDDFYLVNSTFSYFPGIPVFHSKDLVHWELLGHVLDRPEQLNLDGQGVSRGIFAPAIRHHDGVFYVTCTLVDIGGNFVATAKSPSGPWSNPVWLHAINGIDPSPFFDDDGTAFIVYNSIPPDNAPLYSGHRTIRMIGFDTETLTTVGDEKILVNGGTDIAEKPVWIEGPHIFTKDGYYYLIAAEGGTGDRHSEVVFRSAHVDGPYESYARNPILTQRTLDPQRKHPITSTGHADVVKTRTGDWWAVFLGCRPYADDMYNTGRETFLAPVAWQHGWPLINPGHAEVQYRYRYPVEPAVMVGRPHGGNFTMRDEFDHDSLDRSWMFLRTPHERWYDLRVCKGFLTMRLRPASCSGLMNPSFLGHRQQHLECSAATALAFRARHENEKAGLIIFQNEHHYYYLCSSLEEDRPVVQLYRSAGDSIALMASTFLDGQPESLGLKIEAHGNTYSFLYAQEPRTWMTMMDSVDGTVLSAKVAGGFVGCVFALYATSLGGPAENAVSFDWFEYVGNDEVYR
jgi:xylan 1,4-beta-xylosidase